MEVDAQQRNVMDPVPVTVQEHIEDAHQEATSSAEQPVSGTEEDRWVLDALKDPLLISQQHCSNVNYLTVSPLHAALFNSDQLALQKKRRSLYFTATASDAMRVGLVNPMIEKFRSKVDIVLGMYRCVQCGCSCAFTIA